MPDPIAPLDPRKANPEGFVAWIQRLFSAHGSECYEESVTQLDHALQAAELAHANGAGDEMIVAALLHDVGHMLSPQVEGPSSGTDDHHEVLAARALEPWLPNAVILAIAQHVMAKRWLCTKDERYRHKISPASLTSLELQGGLLSPEECEFLEAREGFADAIALRRWDDEAKIPDLRVPPLDSHLDRLCSVVTAHRQQRIPRTPRSRA